MSLAGEPYINPMGEFSVTDISFNNIGKYMKNKETRAAQVLDAEKKTASNNLQLGLWSFTAAIILFFLLVFIKNIDN